MAKRRKLEAPSTEEIGRIEAEFRREIPTRGGVPPIAQIAGDVADHYQAGSADARRDDAQAKAYREAEAQGRVILEVDLDDILATSLQRDRTLIDDEGLAELEHSIQANGQRLPVEVYLLSEPEGDRRYGLLTGYRRYIAQRNLLLKTQEPKYSQIKAILRDPDQVGGAFVAMVEENEIRQDLSHYERGRIAVIAAQQGAFSSTEEAVAQMFAAASKAKRSKIRSFALIFEELGDVLSYPEALREKDGLLIVKALKNGAAAMLRDALASNALADAKAEWSLIEKTLSSHSGKQKEAKPAPGHRRGVTRSVEIKSGLQLSQEQDGKDLIIRLKGEGVTDDMAAKAFDLLANTLSKS